MALWSRVGSRILCTSFPKHLLADSSYHSRAEFEVCLACPSVSVPYGQVPLLLELSQQKERERARSELDLHGEIVVDGWDHTGYELEEDKQCLRCLTPC